MPLINGTVNYSPGDIIITAYYNNEQLESFPTKDSGYTVNSIVCDNDASASFDENNWEITVTNFVTKGTKCDVTFVDKVSAKDYILANTELGTGTPNYSNTSCSSGCDEATVGLYTAEDDDGTTYYYRGDVNDNWVKFAGFYWRIIRINGDGSIRLIYSGDGNAQTTGTGTQIGTSAFNSTYGNNMYVGYMYTENQVHGLGTDSTIKGVLDEWYYNNLEDEAEHIDMNAGFCNDRTPYSGTGTGTRSTDYAAYNRLLNIGTPTFECSNNGDLFTVSSSNRGNQALTYPIGLITMDEVWYAGGYTSSNNNFYLYTNSNYWTMSPCNFFAATDHTSVYNVKAAGYIASRGVYLAPGIRPVINLRADVTLTGSGTSTNPYVVN